MNTKVLTAGLSALALCVALGGLVQGVAAAGERSAAQMASGRARRCRQGVEGAGQAQCRRGGALAELAVALQPQRPTIARCSARPICSPAGSARRSTALDDSLSLSPGDGKVALNLALAQIADGDWQGARRTLDSNSGVDPGQRPRPRARAGRRSGRARSTDAADRAPARRRRQDCARTSRSAWRWPAAGRKPRSSPAMDLSPTEADKRIVQWAAFARPTGRADQVASLLGVSPVGRSRPAGRAGAQRADAGRRRRRRRADRRSCRSRAVADAGAARRSPPSRWSRRRRPSASVVFAPRAEVVQPLPVKRVVGIAPVDAEGLSSSRARREPSATPVRHRQVGVRGRVRRQGQFLCPARRL